MSHPPAGIVDRLRVRVEENVAAIRGRARRVDERTARHWPGLSRREWLAVVAATLVLSVVIGLGLDTVSVGRARALPAFLIPFFDFLSEAGKSQWELFPSGVLVIVLIFGRWSLVPRFARVFWAEVGALSFFIFGSIGGAGILVNILKQPIGRGRPSTFDEYGAFVLQPFRFSYYFQSFPSGHAATAGALIAIGFLVFPRWRIPFLLFGLAIGASRVVVGAHYPSDVLAGTVLGFAFSLALAGVMARFGWAFARGATGTITARAAAIRRAGREPARMAVALAGLADALTGRPVWVPALRSIGRSSGEGLHGDPPIGAGRTDDG